MNPTIERLKRNLKRDEHTIIACGALSVVVACPDNPNKVLKYTVDKSAGPFLEMPKEADLGYPLQMLSGEYVCTKAYFNIKETVFVYRLPKLYPAYYKLLNSDQRYYRQQYIDATYTLSVLFTKYNSNVNEILRAGLPKMFIHEGLQTDYYNLLASSDHGVVIDSKTRNNLLLDKHTGILYIVDPVFHKPTFMKLIGM